MRLGMIGWAAMAGVAAGMVATSLARDYAQAPDEEKVELNNVPPVVRAKAAETAKGIDFTQAYRGQGDGYRLVGKDAAGALVVVAAREDGRVLTVMTRMASTAEAVPKGVAKALESAKRKDPRLKGFRATSIERASVFIAAEGATEHAFEFRGRNASGQPASVAIGDDGTIRRSGVEPARPDVAGAGKDAEADVPPEVLAGVREAVPGIRIAGAVRRKSVGGATSYLVTGKEADGRAVAAEANSDGSVATVRHDLLTQEVPAPIQARMLELAIGDPRLSGFRPVKAQRLELRRSPNGAAVAFAFLGANAKGTAYEVRVFLDGRKVAVVPASESDSDGADAPKGKAGTKRPSRGKRPR